MTDSRQIGDAARDAHHGLDTLELGCAVVEPHSYAEDRHSFYNYEGK